MKMKKRGRQILSIMLVFVMVLGLMPVTTLADTTPIPVEIGDSHIVKINQSGHCAAYTFTAPEDGRYIMYYKVHPESKWNLRLDRTASPSNANPSIYRNPHPMEQFEGYVLDMEKDDTYTLTFSSNGVDPYEVCVGVKKTEVVSGISTFWYGGPGHFSSVDGDTITVGVETQKLDLMFFTDSLYAYDESLTWDATSSDDTVISFDGYENTIASDGSKELAEPIGFAPRFQLNKTGTADITVSVTYKNGTPPAGKMISKTYTVTVVEGNYGANAGDNSQDNPNKPGPSGPSSGTVYYFSDFDGLKTLLNTIDTTDGNTKKLCYNGAGDFELSEHVKELPNNVVFDFGDEYTLVIPKDIKFIPNGTVDCKDLVVDGIMKAADRVRVSGGVTVNGTMTVNRGLNAGSRLEIGADGKLIVNNTNVELDYPNTISGYERIAFDNDRTGMSFNAVFRNMDELKNLLTLFANDTKFADDKRVRHNLDISGNAAQNMTSFSINENITIPEHVSFCLNSVPQYVVAGGVTMTVNGELTVGSKMQINGTVVNNGYIRVDNLPFGSNPNMDSVITIGRGKYQNGTNARLEIDTKDTVTDITSILPWKDLADYDITEEVYDDGTKGWNLKYVGNLEKLGTPADLQWGVEYSRRQNTDEPGDELIAREKPGMMSWKTADQDQGVYQMQLYRAEYNEANMEESMQPVASWGVNFHSLDQPEYRSDDWFLIEDMESGTYRFSVQSVGDGIHYRNSDVAWSDKYVYVRPEERVGDCTSPTWEDRNVEYVHWMKWKANSSNKYKDGYQVEYAYSDTSDGPFERFNSAWARNLKKKDRPLDNRIMQQKGTGYYQFRVRMLSSNIEEYCNGQWSDWSETLDLREMPANVSDDLRDLLSSVDSQNMSDDKIRKEVQQMDSKKLRATLLTDMENSGATVTLANIENKVGGPAEIEVTDGASSFDINEVSIVGANLNLKQNASGDPITLVLDKPEADHVIPERFDSAVSVKFSMTVTDVKSPKQLEVPVKITLPVPENINPEYLVIIHYHQDGSWTQEWPYVYEENGKTYADIVLTSFSDFVLAEDVLEGGTPGGDGNIGEGEVGEVRPEYEESVEYVTGEKAPAENTDLPEYVTTGSWTNVDGKWSFADGTGETFKNRWAAVENPYADPKAGQEAFDWFFFDENGHMMTGWMQEGGRWYYLNPVSDGTLGCMFTGWQLIGGKWYYLNPASDGTRGAMMTNWQLINDKWYYLDLTSGAMLADTWVGDYYVDASGAWDAAKTR